MADPGAISGEKCLYRTHPNGGGLRTSLEREGFKVHQASYGTRIGERTDLFDWHPKFQRQMGEILRWKSAESQLPEGETNRVVMFKSCFPNNLFRRLGRPPGISAGPELTVWNARSAFEALLPIFARHPSTLFICLTTPPLARGHPVPPWWKRIAKSLRGQETRPAAMAGLAREFNAWLAGDGWLRGQSGNTRVFDYYDLLTGGQSNFSAYASGDGTDSHPNQEGNQKAAAAFIPFLKQALARTSGVGS